MFVPNAIELASRVSIYVPSTVDVDKASDTSAWIDNACKALATMFGGATTTPAIGTWLATNGDLVREDVTIVFAYAKGDALEAHGPNVVDFCERMKAALSQEAVALEVNGKLYLI
jgi:hypothetical protein